MHVFILLHVHVYVHVHEAMQTGDVVTVAKFWEVEREGRRGDGFFPPLQSFMYS